jgi:DNA polymerase-3 subunit alpha
MPKICFIYTDTNGLHKTNDFVSSKNLYKIARLIAIHYIIGDYNNMSFNETLRKTLILKPKTVIYDKSAIKIHKITMDMATKNGIDNVIAMNQLKKDLTDIKIIVSHNLPFHIRAIQGECFRTAISIDFTKYILVDMSSFGHDIAYPKLNDLVKKYNVKTLIQLDQYKELFFILYDNYKKTIQNKPFMKNMNDDVDFID